MMSIFLIHHLSTWLFSLGHKMAALPPSIRSPFQEGRRVKSKQLSLWMFLSLLKKISTDLCLCINRYIESCHIVFPNDKGNWKFKYSTIYNKGRKGRKSLE